MKLNLSKQGVEAYRSALISLAMPHNPCSNAISKLNACTTEQEIIDVVMCYQDWCASNGIDAGPLPAGLTNIGGGCYLRGYAHPLPAGLTSIDGSCYLHGYAHPLPAGLTNIGGWCDIDGYAHPLPAGCVVNGTIYR